MMIRLNDLSDDEMPKILDTEIMLQWLQILSVQNGRNFKWG